MKKELIFYEQAEFEPTKTLFHSMGYEMISLSYFLDDLKDLRKFSSFGNGLYVIDASILCGGSLVSR